MNILFMGQVKEGTGIQASTARDVAQTMRQEARADRECFWVIHLDTRNEIITKELVSVGTLNCSLVHPREVFRNAIKNGAAAIIAVHNHPSGDPSPSREDMAIGKRLKEAGELLGIELLDCIVLGANGKFSSHRQLGYL